MNVVTWKWQAPGYRSEFTSHHVNVLRAMVQRHYPALDRFICVTDDPEGLDPRVEHLPLAAVAPPQWGCLPNPSWRTGPSCYRRLALYRPDAAGFFGPRFVSMDLDAVVAGDLTPILERSKPIVLWADPLFAPKGMYCGSMTMMTAGAAPEVWTLFNPATSPQESKAAGKLGSDQGWVAHILGAGMPAWTTDDGVYSFWVHLEGGSRALRIPMCPPSQLPDNAAIVFFHGKRDPWHQDVQDAYPWVREHWRL